MDGDPPYGGGAAAGLVVSSTDSIRSFLISASIDDLHVASDLRSLASDLSSQDSVPYRSLRRVWSSIPAASARRPSLRRLISGSDFVFVSPKPREKSEELKERLKKLTHIAERKEYEELVKDITPKKNDVEPFSSYKDQIGFGLHVVLMMFTGYIAGYVAFRALFNHSDVMNVAGGIIGLVCAMLLETILFIIRASNQDIVASASSSKMKKYQ